MAAFRSELPPQLQLLSLATLLVACTSTVHPPGTARDRNKKIVAAVNLQGVSSVSKKELLEGLALRGPSGRFFTEQTYFDPLSHRLDAQRIKAFYRRHGFLSVKILKAEEKKKKTKYVELNYVVEEGPQTTIGKVSVVVPMTSRLDPETLENLSLLKSEAPLDYEAYEIGKDNLLRKLIDEGYAFAQVTGTIEVRETGNVADIRIEIDPGPLAAFGPLTIVGNNRIPLSAILPRVSFRQDEQFSWKAMEETRKSLYAMGVFASVEFEFDRKKREKSTALTLRLREAPRSEIKLGFGVGVDRVNYEVRGRGRYRLSSFLLPMGQLQLEATPSQSYLRGRDSELAPGIEASSSYTLRDWLITDLELKGKIAYAVDNFNTYSIQGPRGSIGLSRPFLNHRLQVGVSWRLRYQFIFRNDGLDEGERESVGLIEPYRLGTLVQSISYDGRDNVLAPTRGWYASFEIEESSQFLGSAFRYIRASPELRGFYPLGDVTVLAARVRLASTLLIGDVLPITQRYFAGGASSHRGFAQQLLSPGLGATNVLVGGEALAETSLELRRGIRNTDFAVVGFLDGAEVAEAGNLFDNGLHWATGLGVRWRSVVGTFRFDLGYRLNRKGEGEPQGDAFNFFANLGEAF